jgi:acetyl esterase/lipase
MHLFTIYLDQPLVLKRAVDFAQPEGEVRDTAIFYVHGGGWNSGARDIYHYHLEHFSSKGFWCASVGYRLAPQAKFADQMTDVMEGYDRFVRYLEEHAPGIRRIVVTGSSAGAHLASLLALMHPEQLGRKLNLAGEWRKPDACLSVNGPGTLEKWPDMNESIKNSIEQMIGAAYEEETDAFAKASPIRYVHEGCPEFLFFVVEHEPYFPHEYVREMSDRIVACGGKSEVVYFEGAKHGFFYGLRSDIQQRALKRMEQFLGL